METHIHIYNGREDNKEIIVNGRIGFSVSDGFNCSYEEYGSYASLWVFRNGSKDVESTIIRGKYYFGSEYIRWLKRETLMAHVL